MMRQALFSGLIVDERDQAVQTTLVGAEPCYVVDDAGFLRHIPSEQVDRQVLAAMQQAIEGHEGLLSEQAAKMLGQEDIFSKAVIENRIRHMDEQFDSLFDIGIPEETRAYLGMMGFRIRIDVHGEVLEVIQPGIASDEE
jgi:hypothetical protein